MKESVTYQAIVEEGKIEARQEDLRQMGRRRLGPPSESTEGAVRRIIDLNRLAHLLDRLWDATSWDDLLASP